MAPRDPVPGSYDEESTTTSTAAVPSGEGFTPPPAGAPGGGQTRPLTSAWGRDYTARAHIQRTYYSRDDGSIDPLLDRVSLWRQQFAQTGNADLSNILDQYLSWGGNEGRTYGGSTGGSRAPEPATGVDTRQKKTIAWWLEHMRTASEGEVKKMQADLMQAGYYSPDVYKQPEILQEGTYDALTQEAFTHLLKDGAMSNDVPLSELIKKRKKAIDEAGGIEAWMQLTGQVEEPPPFQATVTNPLDIEAAARDVSTDLTGRQVPGFGDGNVEEFQGQEVATQRQAYDQAISGEGGTTVDAPSLGAFTENELRAEHGAEVGAYSFLGNWNALLQRAGLAG